MASSSVDHHMNEEQTSKRSATVDVAATTTMTPQARNTLEEYERLFGVDEDAYEQPTTTRKELWAYYLYYNGERRVDILYEALCSNVIVNIRNSRRQWRWSWVLQSGPVSQTCFERKNNRPNQKKFPVGSERSRASTRY